MIDIFDDKIVSVDVQRDQGFLDGMGIDTGDPAGHRRRGGRPASTRAASSRSSATRPIAGRRGRRPHRDGDLLSANPDINVVYTINEPAAYGA